MPLAILLAVIVSTVAWRLRWLTPGGAVAAAAVGALVLGFGGWLAAGALVTFFVTSTLLGRGKHAAPRTARQVVANGGLAALASVGVAAGIAGAWPALVASLAAANADTWATELGMRFGRQPRNIATLRRAEPGASGGVTLAGLAASALGALAVAAWLARGTGPVLAVAAIATCSALLDSVLGASLQAKYRCAVCGKEVETSHHHYLPCTQLRGLRWMDNDVVNLIASCSAGAVAWLAMR